MPKLELLATVRADLKEPLDIGATPYGTRRIYDVKGGSFEGPRLKGQVLPSGAVWLLVGPDGVGRLDVRATLQTDDGALIYTHYHGIIVLDETVAERLAEGGETQFGEAYFMTQPRYETGDSRYAWLNAAVCVAQGRVLQNAVEYRVFHVVND
jgi:hypothetical protein